jgi:hypothetical protein
MSERPSLTSMTLKNRFVASKTEEPGPAPVTEPKAKERGSFKFMQTRINREGWRELTNLATDLDRPLQSLMIEAINDLLGKHARPKVASGPDASIIG